MNGDLFPEVQEHPEAAPDTRITPATVLEWCRATAGVEAFDLDVAACAAAHVAPHWLGLDHPMEWRRDGLKAPWHGFEGRQSVVWCNPPFSEIEPWVKKAWYEWRERTCATIAMLLPANRCEQRWWQTLVEPLRDKELSPLRVHFLPGRPDFGYVDSAGSVVPSSGGAPKFGCVLLVWR